MRAGRRSGAGWSRRAGCALVVALSATTVLPGTAGAEVARRVFVIGDSVTVAATRWANLRLADWATVSEATSDALYGVGPHLRPPGAAAWGDLLFTTLAALDGGRPVVESFDVSAPLVRVGAVVSDEPSAMAAA